MNILDRIGNLNSHSDTALAKEKAVCAMWEVQQDAILILDRAKKGKCIDEISVQNQISGLNTIRQSSQDNFLRIYFLLNPTLSVGFLFLVLCEVIV